MPFAPSPTEWITAPGVGLLLVDLLLVGWVTRRLARRIFRPSPHPVLRGLQALVLGAAVVVGSVGLLSGLGCLSRGGFLALHGVAAAVLLFVPMPAGEYRPRAGLSRALFPGANRRIWRIAGWLLAAVLVYQLVLAVGTFPGTWDSQTYRLSRVGYWLQARRVGMDFANDSRLYFMPAYTEFGMLWLTSFFPSGYPLVNLPQFFGGVLALLAVLELGRMAGLPRPGRLVAAGLLLGMPNVLLQFSTSQSDLFTAGLLNAGLVFVWRAIRRPAFSDSVLAGLAVGLAFGAKSTPLYWLPGLALWAALLTWRHRARVRSIGWALAAAAALAVLVGGWKYADNVRRFGNPFAPREEIARVQQHGGPERAATIAFVAELHLWQLLQPNSNPQIFAPLAGPAQRVLGQWIGRSIHLPDLAADFAQIRAGFENNFVYEDIVSFGVVAPVLALGALLADAIRRRRRESPGRFPRLAMAISLAAFFVLYCAQQKPNAWNYRYFVLAGPFLAVLAAAAWPAGAWGKRSAALAFLVIALQCVAGFDFESRNILGGWRALTHPRSMGDMSLFESLAEEAADFPGAVRKVAVALPANDWLAPYFRLPGPRRYYLVSLDLFPGRFASPGAYLREAGFDALIVRPDAFPKVPESGVLARVNRLDGAFARAYFSRKP